MGKNWRSPASRWAGAVVLLGVAACESDSITASAPFTLASLTADSVFVGRTVRVVALSSFDNAVITAAPLAWSSTDTSVARVTTNGTIIGVGVGRVTITGTLDGRALSTNIRVVPRRVDGGALLALSAPGAGAMCALRTDGAPVCLPATSLDSSSLMSAWAGATGLRLATLHTAESHSCGLSATGTMYCAGVNAYGQLANGHTSTQRVAAPFETGSGLPYRFVSVGGSEAIGFTCAIRAADSVVVCAGRNLGYQTGHTPLSDYDTLFAPVTGSLKALTVSTGRNHSCAVALDHSLSCWGANDHALFGVPTTTVSQTHVPQRIPGGTTYRFVSSGSHTCAVSTADELSCWGSNASGQLGIGSLDTLPHSTPQRIDLGAPVNTVTAGNGFTCALTTAGRLHCWGAIPINADFVAVLGSARYAPVRLANGIDFQSISANARQICGVTTDGRGICL
ncbi:MAG: Ig-like domain-containing protein [Gemmatimonadaceae bacterium]|nr:Ig-like domain-containing protein [Gemmatimonadaceae bacterium]